MQYNFIYVFDPASRDKLIEAGFVLLKEDAQKKVYVFKADHALSFSLSDGYCYSNTLTF